MPITIAKAYEILALNLAEARPKMPEDVKDSVRLALSALAFVQGARFSGLIDANFRLKGEALEPTGNVAAQQEDHVPDRAEAP